MTTTDFDPSSLLLRSACPKILLGSQSRTTPGSSTELVLNKLLNRAGSVAKKLAHARLSLPSIIFELVTRVTVIGMQLTDSSEQRKEHATAVQGLRRSQYTHWEADERVDIWRSGCRIQDSRPNRERLQ